MDKRRISGIIVTAIGAALTLMALYAASELSGVEGIVHGFNHFFSKNPVGGFLGGELNKQTSAYEALITGCFWTGIALFIIGIIMIVVYRKKRSR